LGLFQPDDRRVIDLDGRRGKRRPKLLGRGRDEFLVYHPNAAADGFSAEVDSTKTARVRIDLTDAPGVFRVEWYRALDGVVQDAGPVDGGAPRELMAPWQGQDGVLRLLR